MRRVSGVLFHRQRLRQGSRSDFHQLVAPARAVEVELHEPGEHGQVAVKVIDDRGNELLVVKSLRNDS